MKMAPIDSDVVNAWSPVGRTVWEGLSSKGLLKEVWEWALRFQTTPALPSELLLL